jgi:cell wall-associated NlpC family hydrolase
LPFGARVSITGAAERFAVTQSGGHIPARHLAPVAAIEDDFVTVAERFLGTPYLWGGKTSLGLDCSGLAQVALTACGIACPRDSDMQEQALGAPLDANANLQRGDLLFWKGHMGIVRDPTTLVHANAYHMAVALEPIADAIPRIRASDGPPTAVKRL